MSCRRKLRLTRETLRALTPARLRGVVGGTVLVNPTDPITAPPTDRDGDETKRTALSCYCFTR